MTPSTQLCFHSSATAVKGGSSAAIRAVFPMKKRVIADIEHQRFEGNDQSNSQYSHEDSGYADDSRHVNVRGTTPRSMSTFLNECDGGLVPG